MIKYLDQFRAMRMNTIYFQVRGMSDAMYKSSYEPWSSYLTGQRGAEPGWDPLEFVVEECHKRGMECHAWVNPYRYATSSSNWTTDIDKEIQASGNLMFYNNTYIWNPAKQATLDRINNVCREIATNYKVDGIIFDDYFYVNGTPANSSASDWSDYQSSGTTLSMADWRRANVNRMVREVYATIQSVRSDLRFGISPAGVAGTSSTSAPVYGVTPAPVSNGYDWQYNGIYSDPLAWLNDKSIDYISPQLYWPTTSTGTPFEPLTKWWHYIANHFGRHHYASHSLEFLAPDKWGNVENTWAEVNTQIEASRAQTGSDNATGCIFYSSKYINGPYTSGLGDYLKANAFQTESLIPVITWKKSVNYDAVKNVTFDGTSLAWDAVINDKENIRYTVYAIPTTAQIDEIMSDDNDGLKKEYLLGVSYTNSYSIPADKQSEYWYAVCVYDGNGNEFSPGTYNAPDGASEIPNLISPINDAKVYWNQQFNWSSVADATYTFQLSENADFSTTLVNERKLTQNSISIDLGSYKSSTRYYWRIKTIQKGHLESCSPAASFITQQKPDAPAVTLSSPANKANTTTDYIPFAWNKVDAASYTLQIANDAKFTTILQSEVINDNNTTSLQYPASKLGKGTFYWRILTEAPIHEPAYSEVRSFTVKSFVIGSSEQGYYIHKDSGTYADVNKVAIESLWYRQAAQDTTNTIFASNGSLNQGFCAVGDYVYVVGRSADNSSADCYLRKFDGKTGEILADINLDEAVKGTTYPCNRVIKDSNGNICVTNYSSTVVSVPLNIYQVDVATGAATLRASCKITGRQAARVDQAAILGDVATGNFSVFAALSGTKNVMRWTYANGTLTATDKCTVAGFFPSTTTTSGNNPKIMPIDANSFFLDCEGTPLTRYSFTDGVITDSFENNELAPINNSVNGGTFFNLNEKSYLVTAHTDASAANGYQFMIGTTNNAYAINALTQNWILPQQGFGAIDNGINQADVDYVGIDETTGRLYIYVPGNGLAAYSIIDKNGAGVEGTLADNTLGIIVRGNLVTFGSEADVVEVYNMAGSLVARDTNVSTMELNVAPGTYIINAKAASLTAKQLILVK